MEKVKSVPAKGGKAFAGCLDEIVRILLMNPWGCWRATTSEIEKF